MSPRGRTAKGKARVTNTTNCWNEDAARRRREELEIYIPPGPRLGDIVIEPQKVDKAFGDRCWWTT
jgi:sulfate-transporting ATPase